MLNKMPFLFVASLNAVFSIALAYALVNGAGVQYSTWVGTNVIVFGDSASVFVYTLLGFFFWPVVGALLLPRRVH